MKRSRLILVVSLVLACGCLFVRGEGLPRHLIYNSETRQFTLMVLPDEELVRLKKLPKTRMLNVEPGCIVVEAYCKVSKDGLLLLQFPLDDVMTRRAMKAMGVSSKVLMLPYENSGLENRMDKILKVIELTNQG